MNALLPRAPDDPSRRSLIARFSNTPNSTLPSTQEALLENFRDVLGSMALRKYTMVSALPLIATCSEGSLF
jgi:hypothetical protein